MKLSRREAILLGFLFFVLSGICYYLFFFQPTLTQTQDAEASIERKKAAVQAAELRIIQFEVLKNKREQLIEEWQASLDVIPYGFDDADFLTRVEKIISPHTDNIRISFPDSAVEQSYTRIYTVEVDFTVPYNTLQTILKEFEQEDLVNRIINLSFGESGSLDEETTELPLSVNMLVDMLAR